MTRQEIQLIFSRGLHNDRDRTLFGVKMLLSTRRRTAQIKSRSFSAFSSNQKVAPHLHYYEANGIRTNSIQMQNFQENIPLEDNGINGANIPVTSQNYPGRN